MQQYSPRICIVRHYYYPEELSTRRQAEYFANLGYQVDVICSRRSRTDPLRQQINGVEIFRLPLSHQRRGVTWYLLEYTAFFLMASLLLCWLHVRSRYDVIQVNTMPDILIFVTLLPRLFGASVVVFMQEPVPEIWITKMGLGAAWKRLVHRLLIWSEQVALGYAQKALTVTEQLKAAYVDRGAEADRITVVLNVPDTQLFESVEPIRAEHVSHGSGFDLICHGAIEERYGQDVAIRAVALLRDEIPDIRLNILGRGEFESSLKKLVEELGLQDQVHFAGFVPLDEMVEAIRRADVGLVPVRRNVYSDMVHTNKMFEYIVVGKPVVISRTRAVEAYFDDSCMWFFESGDVQALAVALRALYHSPDKGRRSAENARRVYQSYRWEVERLKCRQVFEELLPCTPPQTDGSLGSSFE